jgi:hypothetical protein
MFLKGNSISNLERTFLGVIVSKEKEKFVQFLNDINIFRIIGVIIKEKEKI